MRANMDPDFQKRSTETGTLFEKQCAVHLNSLGFDVVAKKWRIKEAGIEVDFVAVNHKGKQIYFECKGGYEGKQPGLVRTDTTKKMLANAFLLNLCRLSPMVVMTSAKPKEGSASDAMIKWAAEKIHGIIFDIIELGNASDRKRLKELLDMDDFSMPRLEHPVLKAEVSKSVRPRIPLQPVEEAVQVAWHSDPKLADASRKKRRRSASDRQAQKVSAKKKRKRDEDTIPLFDET